MIVVARRAFFSTVAALGIPFAPTAKVGSTSATVSCTAFNPPANSLLLVHVFTRGTAALPAATLANNGGLTFTLRNDKSEDSGAGTRARQRIFCTLLGGTPPTGLTLTATTGTGNRGSLQTLCLTGPTALPTNFDGNDAASRQPNGDPDCTFPIAPASGSTILAFLGGATSSVRSVPVPSGGYTEVQNTYESVGASQLQTSYAVGGGASLVAWVTALTEITIGSVIEVPLSG